jgi:hypothetical protein
LDYVDDQFIKAAQKAAANTPVDLAAVRTEYDRLELFITEAGIELNTLRTDGLSGADEFKAALIKFFKNQQELLKGDYKRILTTLQQRNMQVAQRKQAIQTILATTLQKQQRDLEEVHWAQRSFANRNDITLR